MCRVPGRVPSPVWGGGGEGPFIHSSNYCFLRVSWELGTLLDAENTEMNKMGKISALMGHVGGGGVDLK